MFDAIVEFITDFLLLPLRIFETVFNWFPTYLGDFVTWFRIFLEETIPQAIAVHIPMEWIDFINQPLVETVFGLLGDILWFYPFVPILGIYSAAYAAVAGIRIARYVIGFIPGVDG